MIYSYVDGTLLCESKMTDNIEFKKLVMNFADNTDYLDNLKIYEFNGYTQSITVTDARPKSNTITLKTTEPLNAATASTDSFIVTEGETVTDITDVTLSDNNTKATLVLSKPLSGGRNYTVTARRGLKNFANMCVERDLSVTVAVPRAVKAEKYEFSDDNKLITATVTNNESGRSTAVLVVCVYNSGSTIPDKILTDSTFDTEHTSISYLEPNESGALRVEGDFANAEKIYAYLWENLDNCAPYCNSVRLK